MAYTSILTQLDENLDKKHYCKVFKSKNVKQITADLFFQI